MVITGDSLDSIDSAIIHTITPHIIGKNLLAYEDVFQTLHSVMVGSMVESRLGITAAAHFAASQKNITRFDFDAPLMLEKDTVQGGVIYTGRVITLPDAQGLGISDVVKGE